MSQQTKVKSFIEANVNSFIGYWVSVLMGHWLYPMMGVELSLQTNMILTAAFVVVSTLRSYLVRRFFNWDERELK